ncbi:apolipoprotein N-acyltransferase [Ideonella sp. BN130291]|uniref:apolipoprotein N-acyltransferase n=1 Tax=Ideonella sp. BN130291 TaxID=3112940 RepID=UPI002E25AD4A|nr:apolipoprotein N-acyltransferase [Ideonella sp. BN130291]
MLASALLCGLYARGGAGWLLGFVALVPWLHTLDRSRTLVGTLLGAWGMCVAFTAAGFAWFGSAIGQYTQWGEAAGLALLLVAAPLFQPQILVFALVRHLARRWHGPALSALAGAAAWVATEWWVPRLLDDTLGVGLHPSRLLRQAADLGGTAGLTLALLLVNEGVARAWAQRAGGLRAAARPLAAAALVPLLLAGYGAATLSAQATPTTQPLRLGLVQSNIVDYERLRQEKGAAAVVREVLDTHFAMSYDAVERQHADAVLWSETVYPTTFGHPKSEAGAELDREILAIVNAAGVPFVFGTYDRDAAGEYNAAAFVAPGTGLLGLYRKARPFPFTEYVPPWLDGPALRRWLPWTGHWQPGDGARVFPLRLADGREIPVLPLICLDDMDTQLAINGARLGAQAILTLSNDAWFSAHPQGAELHLAAAAFRSIETRLPQYRATTNGHSAVIDATGSVVAGSRMGERTLVIGALPVPVPPRTLMVAWGDWVGRAAAGFLALLALATAWRSWAPGAAAATQPAQAVAALPARVSVLPPAARLAAGALRSLARASLLWMVAAVLLGDGALQANTLAQVRLFAALVLLPEAAAWCVLQAFAARAGIEQGALVLTRGARRLELPLRDIAAVQPWRLPIPGPGAALRLVSGAHWPYGVAHADPVGLATAIADAGGAAAPPRPASRASLYAQARGGAPRGRLDQWLAKFVLFPLMLAIPAFRLHQHIAYGSTFGEAYSFGLGAWLATFALWWAAWAIGVVLCAAALRAAIEAGTVMAVLLRPGQAASLRRWLERLGLAALYLGLPAWLLLRAAAS